MLFEEMLRKEYVAKEFPSDIGTVCITKERNLYTVLRKKYYALALESANAFSAAFDTYKDCSDILEKIPQDFQNSIANVIDEIKKDLISVDIYDWDYDTIYEYANKKGYFDPFYEPFDKISDKIFSIYQDVEAQKQYRENRKNNRARWTGATIGGNAINAYSHQMDIAARNLAEGAAHSLFNMAGNAVSNMVANSELDDLFKKKSTKNSLLDGIFEAAFGLHLIYIDFLKKLARWSIPSANDRQKSQRLLNNIKSGAISKDKEIEICQEIINLNPYDFEIYEYLFSVYGDKKGELQNLADYFGVDLNDTKDDSALKYVQENQGETEDDAVKAKANLLSYCEEIHLTVTDDLKCIQYIQKILDDFDLQYRTVDGVVCETRDGADFARAELEGIQEFMKDISAPTSASLLDYEEKLLQKKEEFNNKFTSELKSKYLKIIDDHLSDFDSKFRSTRVFKSVDRKQAGRDKALEFVQKLDFSTLEGVESAYSALEEYAPKVGITKNEAVEAIEYLEKQKTRIASGKGRSVDIGIHLSDIKIPIILLVVFIVTNLLGTVTGIGLLGIVSFLAFVAMIISIVMLIVRIFSFRKSKNSKNSENDKKE